MNGVFVPGFTVDNSIDCYLVVRLQVRVLVWFTAIDVKKYSKIGEMSRSVVSY